MAKGKTVKTVVFTSRKKTLQCSHMEQIITGDRKCSLLSFLLGQENNQRVYNHDKRSGFEEQILLSKLSGEAVVLPSLGAFLKNTCNTGKIDRVCEDWYREV